MLSVFLGLFLSLNPFSLAESLEQDFKNPPDTARPGVYWYFMDGNQTRECMEADLKAMRKAGLSKALFLEVDIGVPRGPVAFMSAEWQDNFVHAVRTAAELGMEIILGTGPGWAGAGGPWIDPPRSMQHLRASRVDVAGPGKFTEKLPVPPPRHPSAFAGLSQELARERQKWHEDVAVLAFRTPEKAPQIDLFDVKVLNETQPYTIRKHVPRYVPTKAEYWEPEEEAVIDPGEVIDLTGRLKADGSLDWDIPEGQWTVMRFAARNNSITTRPAPKPGHGFEVDRFSSDALAHQFEQFHQKLLDKIGKQRPGRGWTGLHLDSWESSSQNWSADFRAEFKKRRGYDPQPFFPAYAGLIVGSHEKTERFLWDLRKTAQDLVLEEHAGAIKKYAHENGMYYSNEPYDMNPAGDLDLGSVADIPMCEFWTGSNDAVYSCFEAVSIAHTMGRPVVRAEAFTTAPGDTFKFNPADMKNQTDWAFAMGINDLMFHTFQHQPLGIDGPKPGMSMGPYGLQWHRNETFWPMVKPYHDYLARCGYMLRQGVSVADVLYLTPEGAPHIFLPPEDATRGSGLLREKKEYSFDAVSPRILMEHARVEKGRIAFSGGSSYRTLVLPNTETMTPELLAKIRHLVRKGATAIGNPPLKSPSLVNYPACDTELAKLVAKLWESNETPAETETISYGKGRIVWGGQTTPRRESSLRKLVQDYGQWIWFSGDESPRASAVVGTRFFRKTIAVDPQKKVKKARMQITADNEFKLWVNGEQLATGDNFNNLVEVDVAQALKAGENILAVAATNVGERSNPAGLIAAVYIEYADGSQDAWGTDKSWLAASEVESGWQNKGDADLDWPSAKLLGGASIEPWNLGVKSANQPLYPTYASTSALLRKWGENPLFESDGPIRFHQRRTKDRDIFFVANRDDEDVEASCVFRTDGGKPELWNPVTGVRRKLPQFDVEADTVSVPLKFAAQESCFVVFDRDASRQDAPQDAANFPSEQVLATLSGPYELSFDPEWGGPKKPVIFEDLIKWNKHELEGIRYYSGTAIYRKKFDLPETRIPKSASIHLDLGTVHKLARVKLNGEDLGIVWTPPYRVDVNGKLRETGNVLELEVCNTWVNRLIGDKQPHNRNARKLRWENGLLGGKTFNTGPYTFTTSGDYNANSPLQESGLLGPVQLIQVRQVDD